MSALLEQHNLDTSQSEKGNSPFFVIGSESISSDKKFSRRRRYELWEGELDEQLFRELSHMTLLKFNPNRTVYDNKYRKRRQYQGNLFWDQEGLGSLPLEEDDCEKIKSFLMPKENITYDEAEAILAGDPNLLVSTMTLLVSNYLREMKKAEENLLKTMNPDSGSPVFLPFLFTDEEEKIFFTGKTLLLELNRHVNSTYVVDLITKADEIITAFNLLLVASLVSKHNIYLAREDAFQDGCIGLLRSLEDFDIDKDKKFSTYASWWIKQKIKRANSDKGAEIRVPTHLGNRVNRILKEVNTKYKMNSGCSREQILEEILEKYSSTRRKNIKAAINSRNIFSLDEKRNSEDDEYSLLDRIASKSDKVMKALEDIERKEIVRQIFDHTDFTPIERRIIKYRFGIGQPDGEILPLKEIGRREGVTGEAIRQTEVKALEKLGKGLIKLGLKKEDILY